MKKPAMPLFWKIISCVLIASFLVLGLIGLILPIIPGILFLFLALLLLTKVSRRAAVWAGKHRWFNRQNRLWQQSSNLSIGERLRLGLLVGIRSTVQGVEALTATLTGNRRDDQKPH